MNWNYNDSKYIIKKLIIYFLIAIFIFIINIINTKALTNDFVLPNIYITSNGSQSAYTNTSYIYNGSWVQGYQGSTLTNVSKVAWEFTDSFQDYMEQYDYVAFYVVGDNDTSSMAVLNGLPCEQFTNYRAYSTTNELATLPAGYTGFICQTLKTSTQYIDIWLGSPTSSNNLSRYYISRAFTFFNGSDKEIANAVNEVNDSINNSDVSGASNDADNLTNNDAFNDSSGLESVIQLPFNMVSQLSNTCQPITITIPFIDYTATIPCMSSIYTEHFNSLYNLIKVVINGFLIYRILLKVYELVHSARQPDEDKLEVIEL